MVLIRSSLYFLTMVLSILLYGGIISLFGWFLPGTFSDVVATHWGKANLFLMRWICGLKYRIEGELPEGPYILMANHQSTWETISLRGLLPPDQSWILKKELMRIPVFGWALKRAKAIAIDRSMGRQALKTLLEDGVRRLQEGRIVIVFPEGTRTAVGQHRKYGIGGGMLAQKSGFPVIALAHNAGVFWRRRGVKKYPGTIDVRVSKPIETQGRKAGEITSEVEAWIEARKKELPDSM